MDSSSKGAFCLGHLPRVEFQQKVYFTESFLQNPSTVPLFSLHCLTSYFGKVQPSYTKSLGLLHYCSVFLGFFFFFFKIPTL